jgi:hypothetical protein
MFSILNKLDNLSSNLYTKFKPLDERSEVLKLKGECVVAWPLSYGVIWWSDNDKRHDVVCLSRHFNRSGAELLVKCLMEKNTNIAVHYEVVKLLDDK